MPTGATELKGARFFDQDGLDRGWARRVTYRAHVLSGLAVLDVVQPGPELGRFLACLDRIKLVVLCTDEATSSLRFKWASGYEDGDSVRVQGVLET